MTDMMPQGDYTVHLCPPDYPRHLQPFGCPHKPEFQMCASARIVNSKIVLYNAICMACGKPLSGGNVFACITECFSDDVAYNAVIATHLRYLSERYLRVASKLFDGSGWNGRHRAWAELIDPNLTMRVTPRGSYPDGTHFFAVSVDESYFLAEGQQE